MSVIIEPAEQLEFHRPFTRISKESLLVKNPGNQPVIFKVKTTAPKQYCVRPNAGRIEPNSEIEVQIILQPFKEEPAEDYKCKDKFLVQTAPILNTFEQQDVTSMWSYVESAERASMHQHKIRCVFSGPREENEEATGLNEEKVGSVAPIPESGNSDGIASSPTTTTTTTAPIVPIAPTEVVHDIPSIHTTAASTDSLPTPISRDIPAVPVHHEEKSIPAVVPIVPAVEEPTPIAHPEPVVPQEQPKTELPTVAAAVLPTPQKQPEQKPEPIIPQSSIKRDIVDHSTTPFSIHSSNDKETELKDALEKIKLLEQRLQQFEQQQKEEGLRARNNNNGRKLASSVQPLDAVHQHLAALEKPRADEGYPPQVVMIVAAVVFIFTYMFF